MCLLVSATVAILYRSRKLNSELFEKQENKQGEAHEEHVGRKAAKQVINLDDNVITLPCVRVVMEGTSQTKREVVRKLAFR